MTRSDSSASELPVQCENVRFPFASVRAGQAIMIRDIDGAVASGLTLLCCAPTGIGKTAAALYPTLSRAVRERRRVFFVTSRNSQQELALETARQMIEPDRGVCAVQIRAMETSCPRDGRRCREESCRYQERFGSRLARSGLLDKLADQGVVSGEELRERALERRLCPFEVSLSLAERAQLVISDLNYVFDPRVYLRRFFDSSYERDLLVVDEAHDLPDRVAQSYSPELPLAELDVITRVCLTQEDPVFTAAGLALGELGAACRDEHARLAEERDGPGPYVTAPPRELFERLGTKVHDALVGYETFRKNGGKPPFAGGGAEADPVRALLYRARELCGVSEQDPERFALLWSREQAAALCLDPAPFVRERAAGFRSAVFMSATLTPREFFAERLGAVGPDTESLELPSPFPRENRLLVAATGIDTRLRARDEQAPAIAALIARTAALRTGNYLAFFPSYAFRDQVVSHLPRGRPRVLLQLPGMPVEPLLQRLRGPVTETRIVCGVQGGVLAQGVDYPGHMAIGVFVVGPGLPAVTVQQELIRSYYEGHLGQGFEFAYRLPGLSRAVQAGGRAIRTHTDRAFVLLVGQRFAEPAYRDRLPAHWRGELLSVEDPVPLVRDFWSAAG